MEKEASRKKEACLKNLPCMKKQANKKKRGLVEKKRTTWVFQALINNLSGQETRPAIFSRQISINYWALLQ